MCRGSCCIALSSPDGEVRAGSGGGAGGAEVGALLEFLFVDEFEHGPARRAHHGHHELGRLVGERVAVLVVDGVTARLPERPARLDDTLGLPLQLETDRTLGDVAERRTRVTMWRSAGVPRLPVHMNRHGRGTLGNGDRRGVLKQLRRPGPTRPVLAAVPMTVPMPVMSVVRHCVAPSMMFTMSSGCDAAQDML